MKKLLENETYKYWSYTSEPQCIRMRNMLYKIKCSSNRKFHVDKLDAYFSKYSSIFSSNNIELANFSFDSITSQINSLIEDVQMEKATFSFDGSE